MCVRERESVHIRESLYIYETWSQRQRESVCVCVYDSEGNYLYIREGV